MSNPEYNAPDYEVIINTLLSLSGRISAYINGENKPKRITEVVENQDNKEKRS